MKGVFAVTQHLWENASNVNPTFVGADKLISRCYFVFLARGAGSKTCGNMLIYEGYTSRYTERRRDETRILKEHAPKARGPPLTERASAFISIEYNQYTKVIFPL